MLRFSGDVRGMTMKRLALAAAFMALPFTALAETPAERGKMLVEGIAGCGNCHTPRGPDGPLPGMTLAGNNVVEDNPAFRGVAANITPDKETGIGAWTDAQIAKAIREGLRPDGSLIGPPMPINFYRGIGDEDLAAIVAYLRSVPPVHNVSEKSTYHIKLPPAYGPPVEHVVPPPESDKVAYGAYLAGPLGHCLECHTPLLEGGKRDMAHPGKGGQVFSGPWGKAIAANITPSRLDEWSDAEIERAIRTGISRDGHKLKPPMGYAYYANIPPAQMQALVAFIRSLPPS